MNQQKNTTSCCNKRNLPNGLVKYKHANSTSNEVQLSANMLYAISVRNNGRRILTCSNHTNNITMNMAIQ